MTSVRPLPPSVPKAWEVPPAAVTAALTEVKSPRPCGAQYRVPGVRRRCGEPYRPKGRARSAARAGAAARPSPAATPAPATRNPLLDRGDWGEGMRVLLRCAALGRGGRGAEAPRPGASAQFARARAVVDDRRDRPGRIDLGAQGRRPARARLEDLAGHLGVVHGDQVGRPPVDVVVVGGERRLLPLLQDR